MSYVDAYFDRDSDIIKGYSNVMTVRGFTRNIVKYTFHDDPKR